MRITNRSHGHQLLQGSAAVTVAVAINGAFGFAFWWLAAWRDEPSAVGAAQELYTALTVVACLTSMGLPVAVARFSPDRSARSDAHFRDALVYTSLTSAFGAVVLAAVGAHELVAPATHTGGRAGAAVLLSFLLVGMALAVLVEVRLITMRRWGWLLTRVVLVAVARLPLLFLAQSGRWYFLVVAGLPAVSGFVGAGALLLARPRPAAALHRDERRAWFRFATINWAGLIGSQGPMFLIPLIVALSVSSADFAPFYIAWAITQMTFLLPHMIGQAYLAESSKDVEIDDRMTLWLSLGVMAAVTVLAVPASIVLEASLGPDYSSVGRLLPWLLAGCLPWAVTNSHLARARRRHEDGAVIAITGSFFVVTLGAVSLAAPSGGVVSAVEAWMLANVVVALLATRIAGTWDAARALDRLDTELDMDLDLEGVVS